MIYTDFLIVGQGIAGTLLSFELRKLGKSILVIDAPNPFKASLVAGAVLNPMAGKHWSPSPNAELFLSKAEETYKTLESRLNVAILKEANLHVFHETMEKRKHFEKQQKVYPEYLSSIDKEDLAYFNAPYGQGLIQGISVVDAETLLAAFQKYLIAENAFLADVFDEALLEAAENCVRYKHIQASKIIYCNGVLAMDSLFFKQLPFTKNRGDVLILDIPGLPEHAVYHQTLRLVPKGNQQFWCGSNYEWNFENLLPNENWRRASEQALNQWLKIPFEVKNHIVAQRPTTAGQNPLLGLHPRYNHVAIFNGLGTRGFSSGPYWASEMAKLLTQPEYQIPNYNIDFRKWL